MLFILYLCTAPKYLFMLRGSFLNTHFKFLQVDHADVEDFDLLTPSYSLSWLTSLSFLVFLWYFLF